MTPRLSSSVPVPMSPSGKEHPKSRTHPRTARSLDDRHDQVGPHDAIADPCATSSTTRRKSVSFDLAHNSERILPRDSGKCWKRLEKQIADLGLTTPATRAFADYYVCERHGHPEVVVKSPPKEVAVKYMMAAAAAGSGSSANASRTVARHDSGIVEIGAEARSSMALGVGYSLASVRGSRPVVGRGLHHQPGHIDDIDDHDSASDMDDALPPIGEDSDDDVHHEIFTMDAEMDDASSIDSGYPPSSPAIPVPVVDEPKPEVIDETIRTLALCKTPDHPILHLPEDHNMYVDRKAVRQMVQATEALARDLEDIEFGKKERKKKKSVAVTPDPASASTPVQGARKAGKGKRGSKGGGKKHH